MSEMTPNRKALRDCVIITVVLAMVFTSWPALDLFVSGLFFADIHGFWIARISAVQTLRELVWGLIILVFCVALIALIFSRIFRTTAPVLNKVWEVVVLTYLLGPILLVDAVLKSFWGRARPANVAEFGGSQPFTPPVVMSDQCVDNCSFVSGEGSGATAMLISVLLITRNMAPGRYTQLVTHIVIVMATLGLTLRILMGRHFLSDTLFAMLFVTLIALGLLQLKRYRSLRLF
ncbi:phosphatase PAP2 family protein [Shimia sp.]|uniref:phosphatase PAP2 family protein n=1 Tax=Shimia sp. TaxID=1954381 RepID=UPI00329785D2